MNCRSEDDLCLWPDPRERPRSDRSSSRTLAILGSRAPETAAGSIAAETGLRHRLAADGQRVSGGTYLRSVRLASDRCALLHNTREP
nr:DUF3363 domain-containing protein [Pseudoxanthomonas broegbernensis]